MILNVAITATYDTEADALYIRLKEGKPNLTAAMSSTMIADISNTGELYGIEILSYSKKPAKSLVKKNGV